MSPELRWSVIIASAWCALCFVLVAVMVWREYRYERKRRG